MSTLKNWLDRLFARKTLPNSRESNVGIYIPSKRGGIVVTHEKALQLSTCFACVRVISEDVAKLPWNVFARSGNRRTRLDNSALYKLLNVRPNLEMGSFAFRETLMGWALTWGNGYAEIERDLSGRPIALWPISPDRVEVRRDDVSGAVIYKISNTRSETSILESRDIFHVHGIGFDGLQGYSMVGLAAEALGFALAAEQHGASFYGNNTTPGLALKTGAALTDEGFDRLQKQIAERKGSANAYQGMIFEQGLDFARPNMSQVDAQYTETRLQQVQEVCRWWRVPPHKVGELSRAHFNNIESENTNYATDTLMPWIKRLEEEADYKLIGSRGQASYTKIAIQALMRGDAQSRATFYKELFNLGVFTPNDIRALEDMDPIGPEGDENYIQLNMTTLKKLLEGPADNSEQPSEPATDSAMQNFVKRWMNFDVKRARSAKTRYDRAEFAGWLTRHHKQNARRRADSLVEIIAGKPEYEDIRIDELLQVYIDAARVELFRCYDGEEPDIKQVYQAIMGVIQNAENTDEE